VSSPTGTPGRPARVTGRHRSDVGRLGALAHPGVVAVVALVGLVVTWGVAVGEPPPAWELRLTERVADGPEWVADALYPVMQLGTLAGPLIVAVAVVVRRRDRWLAGATVLVGLVAWSGAKVVKRVVDRDRPRTYLPDIAVREGDGTGLGFLSGHSAVAMSTAVMAMVALPRAWRPVAALLAVLVGVARVVSGVHLPADVVGGWCFGTLVALGGLALLDVVEGVSRRR
jgi:undecaprenyl-diphosphatase